MRPASLDDLLAHAGWLQRLARCLVRDRALADDLAQDVWVAAAGAPPEAGRPPRPWLATVLRNAARMRHRKERVRELGLAEAVAAPSPETTYEQLELHRVVVESVMKLDEPLRTTVLLRFFEDRSSFAIARAMGVPASTVRWRLQTAVDSLRADLDRRFGGRRKWIALFAPRLVVLNGVLLMAKSKVSIVAALVLVAMLGGAGWWVGHRPDAGSRGAERGPRRSGWTVRADVAARGSIRGVVRGPQGEGVAASILLVPEAPEGEGSGKSAVLAELRSDRDGTFRFEGLAPGRYAVMASAEGWAPGRAAVVVSPPKIAEVEVSLGPGGVVLAGRVLDRGGGVVAAAVLTAVLTRSATRPEASTYVVRAASDEEGRYRLFARPGTYHVVVVASGYARADAWLAVDGRTKDFELTPAARVTGVVRERAGRRPVADAEVALGAFDEGPAYPGVETARTDEAGRFLFDNVEAGRYAVSGRRGSLVSAPALVTVNATENAEVEVLVDPAASVSGRVMDEAGRAVADAVIRLSKSAYSSFREPPLRTRSDAGGRYLIEGVLPGIYGARAFLDFFMTMDARLVTVTASNVQALDLRIDRPAMVKGLVLSERGEPVGDLDVRIFTDDRRPDRAEQTMINGVTDSGGRFEARVTPAKIKVFVQDAERGRGFADVGQIQRGETKEVTVRLTAAGSARVSGRVIDADGRTKEGVPVGAFDGRFSSQDRTAAGGAFSLGGLDAGEVTVSARLDDSRHTGPWNLAEQKLTLKPGEHREDVTLTLPAVGRIAGRVLAPDGTPAGSVTVWAAVENDGRTVASTAAKRTPSDADGSFVIDGLPRAPHTLWAVREGYEDAELGGVEPGTENAVLRFRLPAALAGKVVDAAGRPVPDFLVAARTKARRPRSVRGPSLQVHDPSGAFRLSPAPAGTYTLEALTADGARAALEVTLAEGERREGIVLTLEGSTTLSGRVVDAETGAPIAGAQGRANVALGWQTAESDVQGAFSFLHIPPGNPVTFTFLAPGYALATGRATPTSEPQTVRLQRAEDAGSH